MKMVQNEFKFIAKNKIILISLIAIMIIPFLYSIFFLKSVWDPYGSTGNLPVAVVNNDVPTTYEGQKLNAGKDLVKELKKNDQIGWRFVSAKKAKQGLKDKEYYTVITLPKNFSANAATVLDKHPKKMQINYKTNDSLNFIAEVISEAGAKQVNAELRETVTKSYAKVMFKQVKTAGKGFTTAAKGAKKLTDGSITLADGLNTYTAGVDKVNDGVMTMKTSVVPLSDGVKKLADGSKALDTGLQTLNGKTGTLASGASQLNSGASQVNTGASQVSAGLQTLNGKTGALSSGVSQLSAGASDLNKGVTDYTTGASDINSGLGTLSDNSKALNAGMAGVSGGVSALKEGSQKVSDGLQTIQTKIKNNPSFKNEAAYNQTVAQYTALNAKIKEIETTIPALQSGLNAIPDQVVSTTDFDAKAQAIIDSEKQAGITFTAAQEAGVKAKLSAQLSASAKAEAQQIVTGINAQIDAKKPTTAEYAQLTQAVNGSLSLLTNLRAIQLGLNDVGSQPGLASGSAQVSAGIAQLATGSQTLATNLTTYTAGVDTATAGSNKLVSNNTALVAGGTKLSNGTTQLNSQVPALTGGIGQLATGASQVAGGTGQLAAGTAQLNSQVPQLTSGVSQLATGSTTLNGGLVQLNGKIPTLTSGVDQLADGTSQLAANSTKLNSGATQLKNGNKTLTTGLNTGANKVNSIKLTNSTADMFAAPSDLKHSNYSYVPNYGHALAPYVLSLALFVGAIVFNFAYPIRKISMEGQSATAWFLSKIAVGAIVAIGMGLIEPALMMVAGLNVDHPAQFFLVSVTFALTSMAIIMFLSMAFDNPGRFLAMVLLMLQLGGSGGTFPMEITNHFYNVIHPFLPMSYSIMGFRQAITSGLGNGQIAQTFFVLLLFIAIALVLLWISMTHLQKIGQAGISQLDDNQKLQDVEK